MLELYFSKIMTDEYEEFSEEEFLNQESSDAESEGLYEHFSIKVDRGQEPLRIDKFLQNFRQNSHS